MPESSVPVIAVFGSSRPLPGSPLYEEARSLGEALARAGWTVMTGGYRGVMEGASRGARGAGGTVVGITTASPAGRFRAANPFVTCEIRMPDYGARLLELIRRADGYVVMNGGTGTLAELFLAWELVKHTSLPRRPLVLYGARWRRLIEDLARDPEDGESLAPSLPLVSFAATAEEAVSLLRAALAGDPHRPEKA